MNAPTPSFVSVPGARVAYYVRAADPGSAGDPQARPLLIVGSPMDSTGFGTLAGHFTDRVVVTVDPRNTGQSERDEPTAAVSAAEHAEDLRAVIDAVVAETGSGKVDAFGSSGGAMNLLWMVAAGTDPGTGPVGTLVAHEPPMGGLLPDAGAIQAACDDIVSTYDVNGTGPAMARFIALVMHRGELGEDYLAQPAPDPAVFGLPSEDDGSRDDPLMANLRSGAITTLPDLDAVTASSARVVVGVGEESGGPSDGEMAVRSAWSVAERLGLEATVFPSGHAGFLGGEYGQHGKPEEFAARLRAVLG